MQSTVKTQFTPHHVPGQGSPRSSKGQTSMHARPPIHESRARAPADDARRPQRVAIGRNDVAARDDAAPAVGRHPRSIRRPALPLDTNYKSSALSLIVRVARVTLACERSLLCAGRPSQPAMGRVGKDLSTTSVCVHL